jgi:acetyltransferase-like isoleucine patch superfamily enzyme
MTYINKIKLMLRQRAENSIFFNYVISILYSKFLGLLSFRYRIMAIGRCHVAWSAKITGWASCFFGFNSVVGARTWININSRDSDIALRLGDNTYIGQDNFLTVGDRIEFGPFCLTASHCSFICSTHLTDNPFSPYSTTGTSNLDSIIIGANCFFGYGAIILGNVNIGHGSIIGAGSLVNCDIAPFSMVVGRPAKVVKYFDFTADKWVKGERPLDKLNEIPLEEQYIKILSSSRRFIIQPLSASSSYLSDI